MCLRAEGIHDNGGGVGRARRDKGLSNNDRSIDRGQEIRDASAGSDTTIKAKGDRRRGIDDGG